MGWGRRIFWLIVLALVVAAILWAFRPQPVKVETAALQRGLLRVTVQEEGKTRVIDRFVLSAPVPGFLQRMNLDVGDPVRRGQVLARLEPLRSEVLDPRARATAEARVATAEARLQVSGERVKAATAGAEYWKSELLRVSELYERGAVSKEARDHARAEAQRTEANQHLAEGEVEVANSKLQTARTSLLFSAAQDGNHNAEIVTVLAPVSGHVLEVFRESEGVVGAGEPLVEVGDPLALEVEIEVLSADAVDIEPGTRVLFTRWGGSNPLEGGVRIVEPFGFTKISALGVEEQRVRVIADFVSPREQWERLGHGYRVQASFIIWEEEDTLKIPSSALFRFGNGWAAFVIEAKQARRRMVQLGRHSGLEAQILSGLKEAEVVITHPDDSIEDGTLVEPRHQPDSASH